MARKTALHDELRAFAAQSLDPLPNYQILSLSLDVAFDNKVLVLAHEVGVEPRRLAGFSSSQWLDVPGVPTRVLDTGLTIIAPALRSTGLTGELMGRVFLYTLTHVYPRGHWLINLSDTPSVLGYIAAAVADIFPSPTPWAARAPSQTHLTIAKWVDQHARRCLCVPPDAPFEIDVFVFRGSNAGTAFMKDVQDNAHRHREEIFNAFYGKLMRRRSGDEVLQVGFLEPKHVARLVLDPSFRRLKGVQGGYRALL